jgi:mannose-1-phosphate guanylyltransferase
MAMNHRYALILAGGRGTRFWPRSRKKTPKQLLALFGERTLLQETAARLRPLVPPERTWVLTSEELRRPIARQLPEIPRRQIVAEPAQCNTAPCIGLAAQILGQMDPTAVLGIFPADHRIDKPARFRRLAAAAYRAAEKNCLVVIGIRPRWPETGYGYIEFPEGVTPGATEAAPVLRFREKPDLETAKQFLAAGRFYWNSGMFFWRAGVFLDAFRECLPKTASLLAALPRFGCRGFERELKRVYPRAENISVDYAVLEKASNVVGLVADDIGWNDLGSWNAVYEVMPKDGRGNVVRSDALLIDAAGNYIEAPGKLVALVGLNDLVVVDTADALLIVPRARAQQVGEVVKRLEAERRQELL